MRELLKALFGPKWYPRIAELIRFGLVGLINTALDTGVFSLVFYVFLSKNEHLQPIAFTAGYLMGVACSFVLNKLWTFKNTSKDNLTLQIPLFLLLNLFSWGVGLGILELYKGWDFIGTLAKIGTLPFTMGINYLGSRWLFKKWGKGKIKEEGKR